MIVLNAIGIAFCLLSICGNILGPASNPYYAQYGYNAGSPVMGILIAILGIAGGAFAIFAMTKMKNSESYSLAMAGVIVSMVPCVGPCCFLGTCVGIWPLVVLMDEQVKASFKS